MDRRAYLTGLATATAVSLGGCAGIGGSRSTPSFDIGMRATAFDPPEFEISVGEEVVWKNTNSRAHSVTAYEADLPDGAAFFASGGFETEQAAREGYMDGLEGAILSGDIYTHRFEVAGVYPYFCIPHERGGMVGTIHVE